MGRRSTSRTPTSEARSGSGPARLAYCVAVPLSSTTPSRLVVTAAQCAAILAVGLLCVGFVYTTTPDPLPVDDLELTASVPAGQSVYVGVFAPPSGFDRTLHVSGVQVHTTSTADVSVVPLLCRAGDVGVTLAPGDFCEEVVDPEGNDLTTGDDVLLQVTGSEAAVAVVDRVQITFRDGLRWGTLEAGNPTEIRILPP